ncbi:MAG: NADH dehydrogenase FAD-containing subunit [Candidatus Eremiobacteraeota bacterium]|nr:NADH dehydrogenase FAD-containing subunit [Candidatus Eremiobacteraeota bacterium]MBC5802763.1 NADH dehydrogenase FAD-containing subunit [Candidatus Eremiobacteraeota bacterium]MBC5821400.1 NADH dehydrogenase FAD-containing subunit [Candidatus Eremiobacteraeota bacterium]
MSPLVALIVAVPGVAAVASGLLPSCVGRPVTALAGLVTAAAIVALAWLTAHHQSPVDAVSALFLLPVAIVYGGAGLYSHWYVVAERDAGEAGEGYRREFLALTNAFACAEAVVPLLTNVAGMWVALEATTIVAALLVRLQGTDAALEAAWKYILIASCGLGLGLVAVVVLYASAGSALGMHHAPEWAAYMHAAKRLEPDGVRLSFIFALIGFGTKMGLAPMHTWLPDAHGSGPTPTSAMLSGIILSDALYVIVRFTAIANAAVGPGLARGLFFVVGLLSLFLAAFFLLQQRDVKRMLAYSSIEHMGIVACGFGFGVPLALTGALLHTINHSASKSLGFFAAGRLADRYHTREIAGIRGAASALPVSGGLFVVAALALAGLPPFGIFRSELMIVSGGFGSSAYVIAGIVLALLLVAFGGIVRWVTATTIGDPPDTIRRGEAAPYALAAMSIGFVVVLGLGLAVPGALGSLIAEAAAVIGGTS